MDQRVQKIISLIKDDPSTDRTLDELARAVNLSSSRLNHLFKLAFGLPVAKYVKSLRMQRAKELLETTFLSVKEITAETGYKDESHFVQNFKAAYGLTPAQYRRNHQRINVDEERINVDEE